MVWEGGGDWVSQDPRVGRLKCVQLLCWACNHRHLHPEKPWSRAGHKPDLRKEACDICSATR